MNPLTLIQVIISVLLTVSILLQGKGTGFSGAFKGNTSYHTRRGLEKSLFQLTIILTALFTLTSIAALW